MLWTLVGRLIDPVEAMRSMRPFTPGFLVNKGEDGMMEVEGKGDGRFDVGGVE